MNYKTLPFYMTYPLPMFYEEENRYMKDLDYLQQMYPAKAKRYQKKISDMLDRMDYEGSMIYDEYPDRLMLYKLAQDTLTMIKQDAQRNGEAEDMDWKAQEELIQILLFYEIFKRRNNKQRGILKF